MPEGLVVTLILVAVVSVLLVYEYYRADGGSLVCKCILAGLLGMFWPSKALGLNFAMVMVSMMAWWILLLSIAAALRKYFPPKTGI